MTLNEKLVANNDIETLLKDYVLKNASPALTEKILKEDYLKNIPDAFEFVKTEAKKKAQNNCACLTDAEVYGLIMHYLEEDSITKSDKKVKAKVNAAKNNNSNELDQEESKDLENEADETSKQTTPVKATSKNNASKKTAQTKQEKQKAEPITLFDFM